MKKTKILSVVAVLFAMVLTGCNKNKTPSSSPEPAPSSDPAPSSEPAPHEHTWNDGVVTTNPTCTAKGVKTFTCNRCGDTKTEDVAELGHDWNAGVVTTNPTCLVAGEKTVSCTRCDATKKEPVPALGHDWGEWSVTTPADCHNTGLRERFCKRAGCTAKESDVIAKTSHEWGEWNVTKPASCVAGSKERVCSICGDKETEVIPVSPDAQHNWSDWSEVTPASCAKGRDKRTCTVCGIEDFRDVPALPGAQHEWGTPEVHDPVYDTVDVTKIVKAGYTMSTCAHCGGTRLEIDAAQAVLEPMRLKDGTVVEDNEHNVVMSILKTEEATSADDSTVKIKVGTKLDKYSDMTDLNTYAYQGAFSFKFDFDKAADVVVYQEGCMDQFSGNKNRTYYSGADETNYTYGNFEFNVNGTAIDLYGQRKVKWSDVIEARDTEDTTDPLRNSGYSTFGEFLIGEAQLINGENTFIYKRLASYNLILKKIILEVTYPDHAHEAAANAEWVNNNEDFHWKNCKEGDGYKLEKARHEFGEPYLVTLESCTSEGLARKACKVCGYTVDIKRNQLAHDFVKTADNAAGADYIATQTYSCVNSCGASSLRWSAIDFDETKTADRSTNAPSKVDSNKAVKFDSTVNYSGGDTTVKGCHIVWNINVPSAVENAGLSIYMSKGGSPDVFDKVEADTAQGYEYVGGTDPENLVRPDSRYGLKIDGNVIILGKNNGKVQWVNSGNAWYVMPVTIPSLTAGVHEIEIYNLGGYRTNIYNLELTFQATPAHTHTLGDWVTDNTNHWKVCTDNECPVGADHKYNNAAHEWVVDDSKQDRDPTCTEPGAHYIKCMICGKTAEDPIPALGHNWVDDPDHPDVNPENPTCADYGIDNSKCSRCGTTKSESALLVDHDADHITAGTPDADGRADLTCSDCTQVVGFESKAGFAASGANSACLDGSSKMVNGTKAYFSVSLPRAGKYALYLKAQCTSGQTGQSFGSNYALAVGEGVGDNFVKSADGTSNLNGKKYSDVGITDSEANYFLVGYVTVSGTTAVVRFSNTASQGYRLIYSDALKMIQVAN